MMATLTANIKHYIRNHWLRHSMLMTFVVKVMIIFVANATNDDPTGGAYDSGHQYYNTRLRHHLNDNYYDLMSKNNDFISSDNLFTYNEYNGANGLATNRIIKRSNDVLRDDTSDNEILHSSPVNVKSSHITSSQDIASNQIVTNESTIGVHSRRQPYAVNCSRLLMGQYDCHPPAIDPDTQQPFGCNDSDLALVKCRLIDGLVCGDSGHQTFEMPIGCRHTNGYSYETALLLSIFLGMFGADRFYLGYPALGLLKFCTLGFLFLGQLVDIILIALQIVGPADGSHYIIKYFGPKLDIMAYNEDSDIIYDNHLSSLSMT